MSSTTALRRTRGSTAPSTPWRDRIVGTAAVDPATLVANPANWRTHPAHQTAALAGSLESVGWVRHVLVNRTSGFVIDGHARVALALARGEPTVPVVYVELTEDEERLVLASLDPIGALAGTDDAALRALLDELTVDDGGLRALLDELGAALPRPARTDPDDVPALPSAPYVRRGELWRLGRHRLLCGDATDAADVARLLDGERPALTVTDIPYGPTGARRGP